MMASVTHYSVLDVAPDATIDAIRAAYRRQARQLHPDVTATGDGGEAMARVNEAWRVLSNSSTRRAYDNALTPDPRTNWGARPTQFVAHEPNDTPQPPPQANRTRRMAWITGVQSQIARLSRLAGRSASQAMLVRSNRAPRQVYEAVVEQIIGELLQETESRVRAARAAGAAPLDLGVAATLIGLRSIADRLRRDATLGITAEVEMKAELIDRMWDILAHELTKQLTVALGGNPHVGHALSHR